MISDARTLPADATLTADIAVIGAGPAAIAMARVWAGLNLRVLILEFGGA
jgi:ribulose 1,5-bisphosphate synthetase/thiazole synthase